MQQHQNSNFATYSLPDASSVFDTFFILSDWGGGDQLYALQSPEDRRTAQQAFIAKGFPSREIDHRQAFELIRAGMRAWSHTGDVVAENVWLPLAINARTRAA